VSSGNLPADVTTRSGDVRRTLMPYYVEQGVDFTNRFGDINESFCSSVEGMYEQALKLIVQHDIQEQFERRYRQLVKVTAGIGWGFHDQLSELHEDAFE
jgi:hypothetical protein